MVVDEINLKGKIKQRDIIRVEFKNKNTDGLYMVISNNGLIITGIKLSTEKWLNPNAKYLHTGFFADKEKKKERLANIFGGFSLIAYSKVKDIVGRVDVAYYKRISEAMYRFMLGQYDIKNYTIVLKPYPNQDQFFDKPAPTILPTTKKENKTPPTNIKQVRNRIAPTANLASKTTKRLENPMDNPSNTTIVNPTNVEEKYSKYYEAKTVSDRLNAVFEYFSYDGNKIPLFYVYNLLVEKRSGRITKNTVYCTKEQIVEFMRGKPIKTVFRVEGSSYIQKYKNTLQALFYTDQPKTEVKPDSKPSIVNEKNDDMVNTFISTDEEIDNRITSMIRKVENKLIISYLVQFRNCTMENLKACVKGEWFPVKPGTKLQDMMIIKYRIIASRIIGGIEPYQVFNFNDEHEDRRLINKICSDSPITAFEYLCTNVARAKQIIILFIALRQDPEYIKQIMNKFTIKELARKAITPFYEMVQGNFVLYEEGMYAVKKKFNLSDEDMNQIKENKIVTNDTRVKPGCKFILNN